MGIASKDWGAVAPQETVDRGFDFADGQLADGEYLTAAAFTVEVDETATGATPDADPNSRKSGSPGLKASPVSGVVSIAVQRFTGMVPGNRYRIIGQGTTNLGQTVIIYAHIWCRIPD